MPTKKVPSKKAVVSPTGVCPCCGGHTNQAGLDSAIHIIFGGLVVALSFFLLETMI